MPADLIGAAMTRWPQERVDYVARWLEIGFYVSAILAAVILSRGPLAAR